MYRIILLLSVNRRKKLEEELLHAKNIVKEINASWAFPESNSELSKYKSVGYMADIGSPHEWWELNCKSYAESSKAFPRARTFSNVCAIAQKMIDEAK
jgi:hypothetical protein